MPRRRNDFVGELKRGFERGANPALARSQKAYMRQQFPFYGLRAAQMSAVWNPPIRSTEIRDNAALHSLVQDLWQQENREYQYAAVALARHHHRIWIPETLTTFEHMIRNRGWWDTVDSIASNLVGNLVAAHPALSSTMDEWINDDHMWIRRTAIIHQLKYKQKTDKAKLFDYITREHIISDKDFFIRKAIGWALREYSKHNADAVIKFVAKHDKELSGLSKREALRWLDAQKKKKQQADSEEEEEESDEEDEEEEEDTD